MLNARLPLVFLNALKKHLASPKYEGQFRTVVTGMGMSKLAPT